LPTPASFLGKKNVFSKKRHFLAGEMRIIYIFCSKIWIYSRVRKEKFVKKSEKNMMGLRIPNICCIFAA